MYGKLNKPMKAYACLDKPFLGDIRPTVDLPAGFDLDRLRDFEIFDGQNWCSPEELNKRVYKVNGIQ